VNSVDDEENGAFTERDMVNDCDNILEAVYWVFQYFYADWEENEGA
jgi:hypothetical protein